MKCREALGPVVGWQREVWISVLWFPAATRKGPPMTLASLACRPCPTLISQSLTSLWEGSCSLSLLACLILVWYFRNFSRSTLPLEQSFLECFWSMTHLKMSWSLDTLSPEEGTNIQMVGTNLAWDEGVCRGPQAAGVPSRGYCGECQDAPESQCEAEFRSQSPGALRPGSRVWAPGWAHSFSGQFCFRASCFSSYWAMFGTCLVHSAC